MIVHISGFSFDLGDVWPTISFPFFQEERPIPQPGKGGMFSSIFRLFAIFSPSEMRPRIARICLFSYRMIDRIFREILHDFSQILSSRNEI